MRGLRKLVQPLAALALVLAVSACAETQLVATTAKSLEKPKPAPGYKIGKPYQINGVWYYPAEDFDYVETGIASWYGNEFAGKPTANGEIFDPNELSAAHRTLPLPSMVRVTNLENGRAIALRINDRGPYAHGRIIDLSRRAAQLLGFHVKGTAKVRVEIMEEESRALAAAGGRTAPGEGKPQAAPASTVVAEALPGSVPAPAGTAPQRPKPAAVSSVALASAVPQPDGQVWQVPVRPTQIYVQAGAFASYENARQLSTRLSAIRRAEVTQALVGNQKFYRVRVGPIASVEEADQVLARVISSGHPEARIVVD